MTRETSRRTFLVEMSTAVAVTALSPCALAADVGGAEAAGKRGRVIAACTKHWDENKGDCSAFVRAVAQDVGFGLTGNANEIYAQIAGSPWTRLGVGKQGSVVAGVAAGEGKFVIAALQGQPNGHVAVVVDYRNAFDSYSPVDRDKAVGFWGKLHAVGAEYQRITLSWSAADLDKVLFAYRLIP
jgi:hypothetical protein